MKKLKTISVLLVLSMIFASCSDRENEIFISNKMKVLARLKSIETGDTTPNAFMHPTIYIQHNLMIKDGHEGFEEVLAQLPPGSARVDISRIIEDGNYVIAHTDYDFFGPQIGFDIFRFENGLIMEHWDNLQVTASSNNQSGHSMIDGATIVTDREKTKQNKALAEQFVRDILMGGNPDRLDSYFSGNAYIQHNPTMADGVSGFRAAFEEMEANGIQKTYDTIHRVFGEGNFVLVISEGTFNDNHTSYYDLFRISNGKIAEHWDVIETIIPESEWQNQNGKFNFPQRSKDRN